MTSYKEIVTKAIVGKAKASSTNNFSLKPNENPNTILGCWVINNKFEGYSDNDDVNVNGSFEVNVWYSYDNDQKTAVATQVYNYQDKLKVHLKEKVTDGQEIIVRSLKQPSVTNANIKDGIINLTIDKELGVEVVGNTLIKVPIEDNYDDYEDVSVEDKIDDIKTDYIK